MMRVILVMLAMLMGVAFHTASAAAFKHWQNGGLSLQKNTIGFDMLCVAAGPG